MARIRSLKPEFFTHEGLGSVSAHARLAFQGLWIHADREGRLKDQPGRLRVLIFPYEPQLDMSQLIEELVAIGVAVRYEVDGVRYLELPGFPEHQRPHPKEPVSILPPRPATASHGPPRKDTASPECIPVRSVGREGKVVMDPGAGTATSPSRRPLIGPRRGGVEYEHPRFDVPTWWHLEKVKGLPGGEADLARFYAHLAAHVEAHPDERTEPRKPWLARHFEAWLERTAVDREPPLRVLTNEPVRTFGRTDSRALLEGLHEEAEASKARRRSS